MTRYIGTDKSLVPWEIVNQRIEEINPASGHVDIGIKRARKASRA